MTVRVALGLGGAGALGGAMLGFACGLLEEGVIIDNITATSAGAIDGLALALGYTSNELHDLAVNEPVDNLLNRSKLRLVWAGAEDSGDTLFRWLDRNFGFRTMREAKIPIKVICTDLADDSAPFMFTPKTTPNEKMAKAARASAAVPKIWDPVWHEGKCLVDGGVDSNLPVEFLDKKPGVKLVGVKVVSANKYDVSTRLGRDEAAIGRLIAANERHEMQLASALGATIVKIDAGDADFLNFGISTEQRQALFDAGYAQAQSFLKAA